MPTPLFFLLVYVSYFARGMGRKEQSLEILGQKNKVKKNKICFSHFHPPVRNT